MLQCVTKSMQKIVITNPDNLYFSSDHHLGHHNIINHCERPYESLQEMDDDLIDRWNKIVPRGAEVVYLGDLTMNMKPAMIQEYLFRLNGRKWWFVYGNHDIQLERSKMYPPMDMLLLDIRVKDTRQLIHCCHYPIMSWYQKARGSWHLYGHIHNNEAQHRDPRAYNVGVDVNNFEPLTYWELHAIINDRIKYETT